MSTYMPEAMVIVYSVVSVESFHIAEEILQYLWRTGSSNDKAVILVGNKADLVRTRNVTIVGEMMPLKGTTSVGPKKPFIKMSFC